MIYLQYMFVLLLQINELELRELDVSPEEIFYKQHKI